MTTVTDLFCGAGGSSLGLTSAGLELRLAANHWARAIDTHAANFPDAEHLCADVSQVDPRRVPPTEVLWASPECTHHSQARSARHTADLFDPAGDPAAERSRATMWDVPRFAEQHRYRAIIVENVVEVTRWLLWPAWLQAMDLLGYRHQVVSLNSMVAWSGSDAAAPQSRDRVYVVFWRGTRPPDLSVTPPCWCPACDSIIEGRQAWKNGRTIGKYRSQYVYLCPECRAEAHPLVRPAASAIDWTLPCPRIGDRTRPLAHATLRRIEVGLAKYGPAAVVQGAGHTFERRPGVRTWPTTWPLPTQMTSSLHGVALSSAFLATLRGQSSAHRVSDPLGTVSAGGIHHGLVLDTAYGGDDRVRSTDAPFPTQTGRQTLAFVTELRGGGSDARPVTEPLATVTASGNHHALIVKNYGDGNDPSMVFPPDRPLGTITARDHHSLVTVPFIVDYHGNGRARPVGEPLGTVDCRDRHGLIEPHPAVDDCGFRMLNPAEIGRAQAFPDSYAVVGSARDRVRQYGNAVSPPAAALLAERIVAVLA